MESPTSSATSPEAPRRRRWTPSAVEWVFIAAIVGVLAVLGGEPYVLEIPWRLLFGWYGFIQMNLQAMQPNWLLIAEAAVCAVALGFGSHYFCRWLRPGWRLRWTAAGLAGVLLLFVTGIAIIGITHQTAWLFTAKGPLIVDSWGPRFKIPEVLVSATEARSAVAAHYTKTGRLPHSLEETGAKQADLVTSKYVKAIQVERGGVVRVELKDDVAEGGVIRFTPTPQSGELQWKCTSNLQLRHLPAGCRD